MHYLAEYLLFLAKALTIVGSIAALAVLLIQTAHQRQRHDEHGHLEITRLNEKLDATQRKMLEAMQPPDTLKAFRKSEAKRRKAEKRAQEQTASRNRVFVLAFHGDIKASAVAQLREEISAVLTQATAQDEVILKLESGGGLVHSYGLAASQLDRLTQNKIPLTVCVDKVAASGGYMMACVAQQIIAAPFAVLGSIGVVAQIPNLNRLLKHNYIDVELLTAGEYKRTLTVLGENTEKGRTKFLEDLEDTHQLFKDFVFQHRPQVEIDAVANGEVWFGQRALEKNLIDTLMTSDAYIIERAQDADVFQVTYTQQRSWQDKLGMAAEAALDRMVFRWLGQRQDKRNLI